MAPPDRRIKKATGTKRDKPTITKSQLERLVSLRPKEQSDLTESKPSSPNVTTIKSNPAPEEPIPTVRPAMQKPNFDFKALQASSSLMSSLPSFLSQMEAANRELEAERAAGTLAARKLEIDDSDEDEDENEDEDMEGAEKRKKKEKRERSQYIEMNLGLGVLEEKGNETSSDESTSSEESSDEDEDVMEKLRGAEKEEGKRAGIEVVKDS